MWVMFEEHHSQGKQFFVCQAHKQPLSSSSLIWYTLVQLNLVLKRLHNGGQISLFGTNISLYL